MIIAKNKLVTSTFYKEDQMLISVYKGRMSIELARDQAESLLDFYQNNWVVRSVIDISKLYGSFAKLIEYYKMGYPTAVKSGLKCLAYVVSEDIMSNNLTAKMTYMANSFGVETNVFNSLEDATQWVKNQKNP